MRCFIPIRDDLLFQNPQLLLELVPYRADQPCFHWDAEVVTSSRTDDPRDDNGERTKSIGVATSP